MAVVARRLPKGAVLGWGAGLIGSSPTPRYLFPWYSDSTAEVAEVALVVPRPGTLRNFRVSHNIPAGSGGLITYTVVVGGVASSLAVVLASTAAQGADLAHSVAVSAGDRVSVLVSKLASIGGSPRNIAATADLV